MKLIITESHLMYIHEALSIRKMAAMVKKLSIGDKQQIIKELIKNPELIQTFDEIYNKAKTKNQLSELDTLESRLIHIFAPSGKSEDKTVAEQKTLVILNSYANLKKYESWQELKAYVKSGEAKPDKPKPKKSTPYNAPPTEYERMADYYRWVNKQRKEKGYSRYWSPEYDEMADFYKNKEKNCDNYDDDECGGGIVMELFDSENIYNYHITEDTIEGNTITRRYEFITKDEVLYKILITIWEIQKQGRIDFHTESKNPEHRSVIELINTHDAIKVFNTIKDIIYDNREDLNKLIISSTKDRVKFYKKMLEHQHIKYVERDVNGQPYIIATL